MNFNLRICDPKGQQLKHMDIIIRRSGLFRKHERSILPELVMELKALNGFESEINPVSSKSRFYFPLSK
jgi:hypothetical protein